MEQNYSLGLGTAALDVGAWDWGAPRGAGAAQNTWRELNWELRNKFWFKLLRIRQWEIKLSLKIGV